MKLKLHLVLGSFNFVFFLFFVSVWKLVFFWFLCVASSICCVMFIWTVWQTWLLMGCSWFLWAPASPYLFFFPRLLGFCFFFFLYLHGILMSDAFCFWLGRLLKACSVVNNEFLSTFIFIYFSEVLFWKAFSFLYRIVIEILLSVNEYKDCIQTECCWLLFEGWGT